MNTRFLRPDSPPEQPINSLSLHLEALFRKHFLPEFPSVIELKGLAKDSLTEWLEKQKFLKTYPYYNNSTKDTRLRLSAAVYIHNSFLLYVELQDNDARVQIIYPDTHESVAHETADTFLSLHQHDSKVSNLYVLVRHGEEYALEAQSIRPPKMDIGLLYGTAFEQRYNLLTEELRRTSSSGLVLIGGKPGTGKTALLKHLVGDLHHRKSVILCPADMVGRLGQPEVLPLLLRHTDSVLLVEDAEMLIQRFNGMRGPGMNSLLNLTDGLLGELLRMQVICTYNLAAIKPDEALARKGRLILKAELDALSEEQAKKVAEHYGLDVEVKGPMTLAELFNPADTEFEGSGNKSGIGFGRG